mgnify:CR=1 FL=1
MKFELIRVLVIIPAHNEQENLAKTIEEVRLNAPFADILVVDDGSTDETVYIAKCMGVKVISLPFNLGIGGAVQTGFKYALHEGYDVVIQVDADGQHDPAYIPKLVDYLLAKKVDIVIGSRYLNNDPPKLSFVRNLGIKYFSWLTSKIIGQRITDCTSGFRALNKIAVRFFSENYPVDFPDAEALILAHRAGLKIAELPASFRDRNKGKSNLHLLRFIYYPFKETLSIVTILTMQRKKIK